MMSRYKPVGWRGDSHRHYLAAKGVKTRVDHRFFVEKDGGKSNQEVLDATWKIKAKVESLKNVQEVAEKEFQDPVQRKRFVEFMQKGFVEQPGNYTVPSYAHEWAERFKKGRAWSYSDYDRRKVLKEVWPQRYGDLEITEDAKSEFKY